MKENGMLILSGNDLKKVLTMEDCIDAMEVALTALDKGGAKIPLRTAIDMDAENGVGLFMPAYLDDISRVSVKTVMVNRNNPDKNLPLIHAMLMLFNAETGAPMALMDGEVITAMRTGAVSGLATRYLARKDAKIAAVIGTGAQGATQLEAVCCVRDIEKAYVFDLDQERAEAFAEKMSKKIGIQVIAATSGDLLSEADVVCTSTSSTSPVFEDRNIKPGMHINAVGAYRPDMAEIPPDCLKRARIVVDHMGSCLAEAGDLIQPINAGLMTEEDIHGELGGLVGGRLSAREDEAEITVFKSVGVAIQDLITADMALRGAEKAEVGVHADL